MSEHIAEKAGPRCQATTERGTPCQKRLHASSDGEFWPHAGGHWFMSDDMYACLSDDHYDPVSVLTRGPLRHLDVPCTRALPPAATCPHCGGRGEVYDGPRIAWKSCPMCVTSPESPAP